ncbi:hypothetical protein V8E54_010866 [Elaphomyces granulatus]
MPTGRPRDTPVAMPALGKLGIEQRQPPPPRAHAPRLRASVRRNLSQFELDNVGMEDAPGLEAGPEAGLEAGPEAGPETDLEAIGGTARTPARGRPPGRPRGQRGGRA